jgi:hypothetical protein
MSAVLAQWTLPECVWRPWADAAAAMTFHDDLSVGYVEEMFFDEIGRHGVVACGRIATHTDDGLARYSALCVIRADDRQAVRDLRRGYVWPPQPLGTVVLLDLSRPHRLDAPRRSRGLWVAVELWLRGDRPPSGVDELIPRDVD